MATIALVWEEGCGWGHVVPLRELAGELAAREHTVVHVSRELERSHAVFCDLDVELWQAPVLIHQVPTHIREPSIEAHVLHNAGFADRHALSGLASAWRALFERIAPDLIVFDQAPVALLAARSVPAKRVTFGYGFGHPPDPFPDLRPDLGRTPHQLVSDETAVLAAANRQLLAWGVPPLIRLADLWLDVDDALVTTLPELDHYGPRVDLDYMGIMAGRGGSGRRDFDPAACRVFVYVKPFPALPTLLETLRSAGIATLVVGDLMESFPRERFTAPTLTFADGLVDIDAAARACDLAVLNAGHGTTAAVLLAGKPILAIPLVHEQLLLAKRVEALGAGLIARPTERDRLAHALWTMLTETRFRNAARGFAERQQGLDDRRTAARVAERIERLLLG